MPSAAEGGSTASFSAMTISDGTRTIWSSALGEPPVAGEVAIPVDAAGEAGALVKVSTNTVFSSAERIGVRGSKLGIVGLRSSAETPRLVLGVRRLRRRRRCRLSRLARRRLAHEEASKVLLDVRLPRISSGFAPGFWKWTMYISSPKRWRNSSIGSIGRARQMRRVDARSRRRRDRDAAAASARRRSRPSRGRRRSPCRSSR